MDVKPKNFEFDNLENGWNNYRRIVYEGVADILERKGRNALRNTSGNPLSLVEERRILYKKLLSDRSYENKRTVEKILNLKEDSFIDCNFMIS